VGWVLCRLYRYGDDVRMAFGTFFGTDPDPEELATIATLDGIP